MDRLRRWWRDDSLAIVLTGLWLAVTALNGVATWYESNQQASWHGEAATGLSWLPLWAFELTNGWQGDIAGVIVIAVASRHFVFKGSAESRDSDDEVRERLDRIEALLRERRSQT